MTASHDDCALESLLILNQCIPLIETLKDPERQSILVRLIEHGPLTVNEVAESSSLSRPAVSHHLKILERNGLVSMTKEGTRRICRAETQTGLSLLKRLVSALEADLAEVPGVAH